MNNDVQNQSANDETAEYQAEVNDVSLQDCASDCAVDETTAAKGAGVFIPEPVKKAESPFLYNLKQILLIFCAALATATSVEIFLMPNNVVIGGALGVASIIEILLYDAESSTFFWAAGLWVIIVNLPILVYCFVVHRRRFAFKTTLYVLFLGVLMFVFRVFDLSTKVSDLLYGAGSTGDPVVYVVLGGALHGVSLPLMLSVNASMGGSDMVGLIAQKRSRSSSKIAMRTILLTNITVVLISAVVYFFAKGFGEGVDKSEAASAALNMFVYSVAAMFVGEIVQEMIFKGFSAAMELEITTEKPDEMVTALQRELKRGTTTLKVVGGYTHASKTMILCVVNKQQITLARRIINRVDEKAFAYVENVREVIGKGFANKEMELQQSEDDGEND